MGIFNRPEEALMSQVAWVQHTKSPQAFELLTSRCSNTTKKLPIFLLSGAAWAVNILFLSPRGQLFAVALHRFLIKILISDLNN